MARLTKLDENEANGLTSGEGGPFMARVTKLGQNEANGLTSGEGGPFFPLTLGSPSPDHRVVSEITWPQPQVLARRSGCTAHLSFGP